MAPDCRTRVVRFLRIAFSAACLTLCVSFIALWVRSQKLVDLVEGRVSANYSVHFGSLPGAFAFGIEHRWKSTGGSLLIHGEPYYLTTASKPFDFLPYSSPVWGAFDYEYGLLMVPYWFLVLITAALAAAPWIHWPRRFGLRTLLIVMTLVALVLGMVIYAVG